MTADDKFEKIRAKVAAYPPFDPDAAIEAAVTAERERCAAKADALRWGVNVDPGGSRHGMILYVTDVAATIRKGSAE